MRDFSSPQFAVTVYFALAGNRSMRRVHRYASREELPFRLAAQHVAIGRLGKIFPALDRLSGRVITVESIPLIPPSDNRISSNEGHDSGPFALIEATLLPELEAQQATMQNHHHIVSYDALHCVTAGHHVFLSSNRSPARLVPRFSSVDSGEPLGFGYLLKDFGKLHPLAVRNYVRGIVRALCTLHEVSSSSILISSDGRAQLSSYFPSIRAIEALLDCDDPKLTEKTCGAMSSLAVTRVLANDQIPRCVFNRQSLKNGCAQDIRSVAYVMSEMLTGMRMRGHLLEREHLLSHVASNSLESQFLQELLLVSSSSPLVTLLEHPYICKPSDPSDHRHLQPLNPIGGDDKKPITAENEQRGIVLLVDHELLKCREQRRRLLGETRAWFAQFERRYDRKPTASERPKSVALLQRRCRLLSDRMRELETRLSSARKSFYRKTNADSGDDGSAARKGEADELENARLEASPRSFASSSIDSKLGSLPAIDVSIRDGDQMRDVCKRSPAQNAFLKRLGPQEQVQEHDDGDDGFVSSREQQQTASSIVSDRVNGHQIIHQRKEVMQVINTIAASTLTTSSSRSSSPHWSSIT